MPGLATAIVPARLGSTRFPRKVLARETGTPLVVHVCRRAAMAQRVGQVVVATDEDEVARAVSEAGFRTVMTSPDHENGTSRLAEAATLLGLGDKDLVVNVQGDEPEIDPSVIDGAIEALTRPGTAASVGTVVAPFATDEDPSDPNIVKAVVSLLWPEDSVGLAIYFSRARVPHQRDPGAGVRPLKHIGIYAYTAGALRRYVALEPTPLERTEKLEQLRWLEHGDRIAVALRTARHHGIDTPEQYAAFVRRWHAANA